MAVPLCVILLVVHALLALVLARTLVFATTSSSLAFPAGRDLLSIIVQILLRQVRLNSFILFIRMILDFVIDIVLAFPDHDLRSSLLHFSILEQHHFVGVHLFLTKHAILRGLGEVLGRLVEVTSQRMLLLLLLRG